MKGVRANRSSGGRARHVAESEAKRPEWPAQLRGRDTTNVRMTLFQEKRWKRTLREGTRLGNIFQVAPDSARQRVRLLSSFSHLNNQFVPRTKRSGGAFNARVTSSASSDWCQPKNTERQEKLTCPIHSLCPSKVVSCLICSSGRAIALSVRDNLAPECEK